MKVDKETVLFKVLTGSHLYGTATSKSDFDYKAVCLPSLDDLLLNKKVTNRSEKPEGLKAWDKMLAGETETEYLPLQVFFNDFFSGQTYALEVAFAVAQGLHVFDEDDKAPEWETARAEWLFWEHLMKDLIDKFLTKNVKKMVGYAVAQSRLYGLKTQRYTSVKNFIKMVEDHFVSGWLGEWPQELRLMSAQKLKDNPVLLQNVLTLEYVQETTLMNAKGGHENAPALDVCGKKFPMTNTWATVLSSMQTTLQEYGARVKEFDGEGVDWKALSHAIRIIEQVLELSETGMLTFPRPNAQFLKAVKMGQVPLNVATEYLEEAFLKVDGAVASSILPERTPELEAEFEEWKLQKLKELYFRD